MKIIGDAGGSTYIVELTAWELAKLTGHENAYDEGYKKLDVKVGRELKIHDMWDTLQEMEGIDKFRNKMVKDFEAKVASLKRITMPRFVKADK